MRRTKKARAATKPRLKKPKQSKTGTYLGVPYDSFVELSCIYFAEELIKSGFVARIERSPSYLLCDPVISTYAEQLRTGSRQVSQTVMLGVTYTPDYDIYFTERALGVFCWDIKSESRWNKNLLVVQKVGNLYRACCEVKPDHSRNSTTPKSVQSMKWLYQKHSIFVNLFRPNRIFEGLFTPSKYLVTERGSLRKLKFNPLTVQQYLHSIR